LVATATVVKMYNTLQAKLLANTYFVIYVRFVFILFYSFYFDFFFGSSTDSTVHKYTTDLAQIVGIIVLHFRLYMPFLARVWHYY